MAPVACKEEASPDFSLGHRAAPGVSILPHLPGTVWGPVVLRPVIVGVGPSFAV